ncbi:MAG: SCO family protein [Dehalococcoidia bacterium]|nr:SCO family protein [Dehalococcoidia bacterium]
MSGRRWSIALALVLASFLVAACGGGSGGDTGASEREGVRIAEDRPRPDFVLTDTSGNRFDFREETAGHLTLLYFGYTNCPDVCPIHFANIAGGLDQVPPEIAREAKVIFVGVDPPRDSPERLREWLDHFDKSFIGLTGTDEELIAAQVASGVPPAVREADPGDGRYAVSHAGWVFGYTPGDEETWQFPLGVRQQSWARLIEELTEIGNTES